MTNGVALENVRMAVREVMREEGMMELVQLKSAFLECQAKLDDAIRMMREYQQQVNVFKSLADAYKRELVLLKEKHTRDIAAICENCSAATTAVNDLERRVRALEGERQELRAAVAAAWSRLVTLVQIQDQKIGKLKADQQTVIIELNKLRRERPSFSSGDTGRLMQQQRARWLVRIRDLMCQHFNEGEIKSLCFDFGLNYDEINGSTLPDAVRELITHFERRQTVELLVGRLLELRTAVPGWGTAARVWG